MQLDGLKKKISAVNQRLKKSDDFNLMGMKVSISILSSEEESRAADYSRSKTKDLFSFNQFYRIAAVALAIRKIDQISLAEIGLDEKIELPELDKDDKKISKTRFDVMREIVEGWPTQITDEIFVRLMRVTEEASQELRASVKVGEIPPAQKSEQIEVKKFQEVQIEEEETK